MNGLDVVHGGGLSYHRSIENSGYYGDNTNERGKRSTLNMSEVICIPKIAGL